MFSCVFPSATNGRLRLGSIVVALGCALVAGCNGSPSQPAKSGAKPAAPSARDSADTFRYAAGLLNGNVGLEAAEAAARQSKTQDEAARRLLYSQMPSVVVDQLNRWLGSQKLADDWRPDALLDTLPEALRELPAVKALGERKFSDPEAAALREVVWLRDISNFVSGEASDELERARRLFDWTVRNIQLDPPATPEQKAELARVPCLPWHLLALGHGQAEDRGWLFALLARQQAMDVALLEFPGEQPRLLAGLFIKDQLYLFDPELGLPLPGPAPESVATLTQIAGDDGLLRKLDLDAEHVYPLHAADAAKVTAFIEASPVYLERRTAMIEARLTGDEKLVLSLDASALAKRLAACAHVSEVKLWPTPYERLQALSQRRSTGVKQLANEFQVLMTPYEHVVKKKMELTMALWRGRIQHLLGRFSGDAGANYFYQLARMADAEIDERIAQQGAPAQGEPPEIAQQRKLLAESLGNQYRSVKRYASYWLGLVAYERENYPTAIDYFEKRTLEATPDGPWTGGARYNLGRSYESLGKAKEAIAAYRSDESEQRYGSRLRAARLETAAEAEKEPE
ncbi:MAG TPA: tetratricopeptide repeat protein [Pirellulales bacterium]|nr:tetratricopeptide repeat protein [Pirellulales bacterium]